MAEVKSTCLRFNIEKPLYRDAWEILQHADKSYNQLIANALIEYDACHKKLRDDPYFETREREDRFVEQIVDAVEQALEQSLPGFLAASLLRLVQPYQTAATVQTQPFPEPEPADDAVDWDFLGE